LYDARDMASLRMLGPIELRAADQVLDLGTAKQRAVFAALAVDANRPVAMATLVDRVWDGAAPAEARNAVYAHLTRIRKALAHAAEIDGSSWRLERGTDGYVIAIDPDSIDLHRFRSLTDQARHTALPDERRAELLREALTLWQGTPLTGLTGAWFEGVRERCSRLRLEAMLAWSNLELGLGHPGSVLAYVHDHASEYPLVEPLAAVLMRALWQAGRPAEALGHYATTRQRLAEELGVDPGAELQELHQAILRGSTRPPPGPESTPSPPIPPARPGTLPALDAPVAPAQLPSSVRGFTGRARELAELDALLSSPAPERTAVPITVLTGTAGTGKTSLAVQWAHQVKAAFPDGQLFVNLAGFDPAGPAVDPAEAVRGFLDTLGVTQQHHPAGLDAQIGLYRSLVSGRRMLLVLDNARDAKQVRPLLPGAAGCMVVITSRSQLADLVAIEGAHSLTVDLLPADDARELLAGRLGRSRVRMEPRAVADIIKCCAGLPLALAVAAARASSDPDLSLSALSAELADTARQLDVLSIGELSANLRAVFSASYDALETCAAEVFRLLGLLVGPDISAPAAADLTGLPVDDVRKRLHDLCDAHLVQRHAARYRMHDLLRQFAAELAQQRTPRPIREVAVRRLVDGYVEAAEAADEVLAALREQHPSSAPAARGLTDRAAARAWFEQEYACLLAAQQAAADNGWDRQVWRLARSLSHFHRWRGHVHNNLTVWRAGLAAAERLTDPAARAEAHLRLGPACARTNDFPEAMAHLRLAADLYHELGNTYREADAHATMTVVLEMQEDYREALAHASEALRLFQSIGDLEGEATGYSSTGWVRALLGDHEQARPDCEHSLMLYRKQGNLFGEASALDSLGYIALRTGRHDDALNHYQEVLALHRELGNVYDEATALISLADTYLALGQADNAKQSLLLALDLYRTQNRASEAERVRRRIDALRPASVDR
jgi:DNA-binding SARP family transcriptional activator/tetratricopeptide (TPR) repeat protein